MEYAVHYLNFSTGVSKSAAQSSDIGNEVYNWGTDDATHCGDNTIVATLNTDTFEHTAPSAAADNLCDTLSMDATKQAYSA